MDTQYYEPIPFHESLPSPTQPYAHSPAYNDDRTEESEKSLPLTNERADSTNA
jgi:hypothetical protein